MSMRLVAPLLDLMVLQRSSPNVCIRHSSQATLESTNMFYRILRNLQDYGDIQLGPDDAEA